jgi:hypothetical protein
VIKQPINCQSWNVLLIVECQIPSTQEGMMIFKLVAILSLSLSFPNKFDQTQNFCYLAHTNAKVKKKYILIRKV